MSINNNNSGRQDVGMQQANERGSTVNSNPQINMGGGGTSGGGVTGGSGTDGKGGTGGRGGTDGQGGSKVGGGGVGIVSEALWKEAHAKITSGTYHIVNQAKRMQLIVLTNEHLARTPVESITYAPHDKVSLWRKWEVRRGGNNEWDLALVSPFKKERYLHDGPHVFQDRNTVRLIPVPNKPGAFYISPNMSNDTTTVLIDISPNLGRYPVTSFQLRNLHDDIRDAQWELVRV